MDLGLNGMNDLFTGGSKGIGLACGRAFRAEGARVAIESLRDGRRVYVCSELVTDVTAHPAFRNLTGANISVDGASMPSVV